MSTLDLVQAIINKDATGIESAFNDTMAEKISARLDDRRNDIAQSMFNQETEVSVEEPETTTEEE